VYKLIVYVPSSHVEAVKAALFSAGAGKLGDYDCCCWQVEGIGQFRPLQGATPFLGNTDEVASVTETKLELVCSQDIARQAIAAMLAAHPYEEPAFQLLAVVDPNTL